MTATIQEQMSALIVRTDATLDTANPPREAAAPSSPLSTARLLVHTDWAQAAPDRHTLQAMTGLLDHHLAALLEAGVTDLKDADQHAHSFVEAAPTLTAWHLRKNTLMAAYNSLRTHGAWMGCAPVHGIRPPTALGAGASAPVSGSGKSTKAPRKVVATSDEVLLARVGARLDTRGVLHRRAAALAIACAGAATAEGAPVCWTHHTPGDANGPATLTLPGRHHQNTTNGWHSAPRTIVLDPWSAGALNDWREEAGQSGRPIVLEWSIVYGGYKPLHHQSAKNCYHALVTATLAEADLDWIAGLTTLSIGEWAAAHATLHHGLDAGAKVMGVDHANCLRRLTKAATRAYKTP